MKAFLIVAIFYSGANAPVFHKEFRLMDQQECERKAKMWESWQGTVAGNGINKMYDRVYAHCEPIDQWDMKGMMESMQP
ncbi:hypothetical protein SAMN05216548_11463 [Faunimonas pinastri]|uniref:Uncharacterized protein n=1 Tax=Faunimonas pinastri TaxID=1855383 RepID=A0A1H9MWR9_9HYPH|nr:hypothetical protein [Faunimonas pinastri]SER27543.1 hypothetical protein SAMN05216548_11463 [Faunimonas pinastri]